MTEKQKNYIEQNIDLIQDGRWETFFKNAPNGTGEVLYIAEVDFMIQIKQVPASDCSNLTSITIPIAVLQDPL